jgi:hypothetical protein
VSLLSIAMDLFLAALMISALIMGVRLNARLKALRQSHEGFARAIVELNDAAVRAEKGLAGLREAATETHDSLLARIDTARSLSAKLDSQIHSARAMLESQELVRMAATAAAAQAANIPAAHASAAQTSSLKSPAVSQPPEALRRLAQRFGLITPDEGDQPRSRSEASPGASSAPTAPPAMSARPTRPSRRPPPGEEDLFEPAHGAPYVDAPPSRPEGQRPEVAPRDMTRAEPVRPPAPPADMVRPDLARPEWARKREPVLAPEDFAARIRARKAAR